MEGGLEVGAGGAGRTFEKREVPLPGDVRVSAASMLPVDAVSSVRSRLQADHALRGVNQARQRGGGAGETSKRG